MALGEGGGDSGADALGKKQYIVVLRPIYSGGSTGKPKPMLVEKKRMLNSARITCDFLGLKPGDSALLCP